MKEKNLKTVHLAPITPGRCLNFASVLKPGEKVALSLKQGYRTKCTTTLDDAKHLIQIKAGVPRAGEVTYFQF